MTVAARRTGAEGANAAEELTRAAKTAAFIIFCGTVSVDGYGSWRSGRDAVRRSTAMPLTIDLSPIYELLNSFL